MAQWQEYMDYNQIVKNIDFIILIYTLDGVIINERNSNEQRNSGAEQHSVLQSWLSDVMVK